MRSGMLPPIGEYLYTPGTGFQLAYISFLSSGKIVFDAATKYTSVAENADLAPSGFCRAPASAKAG